MGVLNDNTIIGASAAGGYEIEQSLRFNDVSAAYLSRTLTVSGSRTTMTISMWAKRGNLGLDTMWLFGTSSNWEGARFWSDDTLYISGPNGSEWITNAKFRDTSAWYHFVFVFDTTNSTESDRLRFYVNGERQTFSSEGALALNQTTTEWNVSGATNTIANQGTNNRHFDGYLSEVNFIDGLALTPDSFGEFGDYGEWKPLKYTGAYGTNGFYLDFKDSGSLGNDAAGSNNWTPTNLAATDQMLDSPTNNFATLNPLLSNDNITFSEGNLNVISGATGGIYRTTGGSFAPSSGKWYFESVVNTLAVNGTSGVGNTELSKSVWESDTSVNSGFWSVSPNTGNKINGDGGGVAYGTAYVVGDIINVAIDVGLAKIWFGKNGTWQASGDPVAGTNSAFSDLSGTLAPAFFGGSSGGTGAAHYINFGQDSSFAGNKTAQGNSDSNGIGDFYYAPPAGFLALCTQNLPEPTVIPSEHFNTVLDTGANIKATAEALFTTQLTWIKDRANAASHQLVDSVRGSTAKLSSDSTAIEGTYAAPTGNSVAWNWKANGTGVSNTDGTITSTVSANVDAGFSIVSYTGTGAAVTVGHGLSVAPDMVIVKSRAIAQGWSVWSNGLSLGTSYLSLNTTDATASASSVFTAAPSASVINIGGDLSPTSDVISYAFHSVDGYSKVGSYTGNGSTDGTFVHCGFRPAYVMIKWSSGTQDWTVFDNKRNEHNEVDLYLHPSSSQADGSFDTIEVDFVSNGFKCRGPYNHINVSGGTYIYLAFAESPFKHSNAR